MLTRKGAKGFLLAVLTVDAFVVTASIVVALVVGAFELAAIGLLILLAGAVMLLGGAITAGAMPMMGAGLGGMNQGLNYINVIYSELLLEQEMRDPERLTGLRARRRLSFVTLASGLSLVVTSLFVM